MGQRQLSPWRPNLETVGRYKNGGQEWQPKGKPEEVNTHDMRKFFRSKLFLEGS